MQEPNDKPTLPQIMCPHCNAELAREFIMHAHGTISARMRTTNAGPAKVIYKCGCGELFSAREIREHSCSRKPARGKETPATAAERKVYLDLKAQTKMV